MVFLISSVFDFPGFLESCNENGDTLVHEFFTELFVFAYTGEPELYDWLDYEEAWYFYTYSVGVCVFPM